MIYMLVRNLQLERRANYELAPPRDRFIVQLLKKQIEQVLSIYAKSDLQNHRALDVGCGCQPFRKDLEALGYAYTSIDVQQNSEQSVDIVCEIDKPLPSELLDRGTFDFILCTEVMEHVVDWDASFSNFAKLLAPGGHLLVTCPHFYQLHEEPHDFWRATPYALQYFGNKFGIKIVYQVNAGDAWDVLGTLLGNIYTLPLSRKLSDRILNKIVNLSSQFVLNMLLNGYIQKSVTLNSSLYQANIAVFGKSDHAD
jgi:2-polyprenyl-3-methyl-5-hydroxy-6-metoxy-1,4-benzoquinol methylase